MKKYISKKLVKFVSKIFELAGSNNEESYIIADHLVDSNLVGHDSHGVIRVPQYMEWFDNGNINLNQKINIVKEQDTFVHIDGNSGYGQSIAMQSFNLGIDKAKQNGLCILDRRLSANPIAIGIPIENNDYLVLDMATSIVAEGKVKVARNKKIKLPGEYLLDGHGNPTNDPEKYYSEPFGSILPFGGHKGFGLAFMIDILSGSLTGGNSSHPDNQNAHTVINNTLAIIIDTENIVSNQYFQDDVSRLTKWVKDSPKAKGFNEILVPGEIEKRTKHERLKEGIPLDDQTILDLKIIAEKVGMKNVEEEIKSLLKLS